jgi:hypothetical protein
MNRFTRAPFIMTRALALVLGMLALWLLPTASQSAAVNLIVNGDFELGNTGFSTGYSDSPGNVYPAGTYTVDTNPQNNQASFAPCGHHTTGTGNMMIVNGAVQPGVVVWAQSVAVVPYHTYELAAWATSVAHPPAALLQFLINNAPLGVLQLASDTCQWQPLTVQWSSGASTTAVLSIIDLNTEEFGNDFALDDLSLVVVGLSFPGTPGQPTCYRDSVSALARQFGGLDAAASALGFPSVQALQEAIRAFCEG